MDTVARVANVLSEGCFQGSFDDSSAFHHILLNPASWSLFGLEYRGVDYVWWALPLGFCESPYVYHALSEARVAYLWSKGTPAIAYLDDSWLGNFNFTYGRSEREQWLAAAEATHVAILVSFLCGYFLSVKKCDLRPKRIQRYLGMLCDSQTATFRVPADRLGNLQSLLGTALEEGRLSFRTLERIAGKCMSLTVAIRPASLWTHAMFAVLSKLEKSGASRIDLARDSHADLVGEFRQWMRVTSTSHEGPWQQARHFTASFTCGSTDASSIGWGGVVNASSGPFRAGGVFPQHWISRYINSNEMYALYHVLQQCCTRFPDALRRAQVFVDVDNQSVVEEFKRGRAKDPGTQALLVQLFDLQVEQGFMLTLKWVATAANGIADAISRPSRESIFRLHPGAFGNVWEALSPFSIDLMASTASAQSIPGSSHTLPFFSQYDCPESSGVDVLAQGVSRLPRTGGQAFGYCFPPPVTVGHVVQHLAECHAHAILWSPIRERTGTHSSNRRWCARW